MTEHAVARCVATLAMLAETVRRLDVDGVAFEEVAVALCLARSLSETLSGPRPMETVH